MTEIKETIKQLEDLKKHCESVQDIDDCADHTLHIKAIDTVVEMAVEEIAERSSGCELCKNYDFTRIGVSKDINRKIAIYFSGGYSNVPDEKQFNYCPVCGRKLV